MANAANEKEMREREAKRRIALKQLTKDFRALSLLPEGVRVLRWIVEQGRLMQSTFTGDRRGDYFEGQRSFALVIYNEVVTANPDCARGLLVREPEKEESDERNSNRDADRDG